LTAVIEVPVAASDEDLVNDLDKLLDLYVSVRGSAVPVPDIIKGTSGGGSSGSVECCEESHH